MVVLELFCGTKSIAKAFEERGHIVFTVDWNEQFKPSLVADIGKLTADDVIKLCGGVPEVIWASPDCTTYSIAGIYHHRTKNKVTGECEPKSDYATMCDKVNAHLVELIKELKPRYYFIENPRAGLRTMLFMKDLPCYTVTYCQYGDSRQKYTDIWTNHPNPNFKPPCKVGDPCHEKAPRGSYKSGTLGRKNSKERAVIPDMLCQHIVSICEGDLNERST